ncbi:MAG: chromosomal replication initiator protein DnaA [Chloroflexi bacterium]|nr:chromosomal replication initiator protein DnaA [Chloroflexota bacterium]
MNAKQVWQAALGDLQLQTSRASYETWLKNTCLVALEDGLVVVGVPNTFAKEWLENRFTNVIRRTLISILGQTVDVKFAVHQTDYAPSAKLDEGNGAASVAVPAKRKRTANAATRDSGSSRNNGGSSSPLGSGQNGHPPSTNGRVQQLELGMEDSLPLNPRYVFERFIVGNSNRLAHAASLAVAEHPAHAYNPLFLYGGVGLGKTHLLHAIGHLALRRNPDLAVLYVSSERFTNDLINAIRDHRTEQFRSRYRTIDILLIDDIQFIAGKESTQEEFFHTFNALHGASKQIVISSDKPPKAIITLEDRLRSRFEGGLIADVQPPDLETRMAIIRAKGEDLRASLPSEVVDFVARKVQSNIRELEGALNRITAYSTLRQVPLSLELASEALTDVMLNTRRKLITPVRILETVAQYYGVESASLRGAQRSREIVGPRQVAMYIMREETESSLSEIGQELGGRDHTTVMHGCSKIERDIDANSQLRQEVLTIRQMLYSENGR